MRRLGVPADRVLVVGDSLTADIAGGQAAGARTALMLTGVTAALPSDTGPPPAGPSGTGPRPDYVFGSLPELTSFLRRCMEMKVVITDCDHPDVAAERRIFGQAGLEVELASCRTEGEVIAAGQGAVALLTQYAPVTADVLARLPECRAVGRYGTGVDNIDTVAARARGVALVSVPDYSLEEVANHTIALILALVRGVVRLDASVHAGRWDFREAGQLRRASAQQVGVVGLGRIGDAVASRAQALGFAVAAHDTVAPDVGGVSMLLVRGTAGHQRRHLAARAVGPGHQAPA